jgi:Ca-activated chloride channel family protein
MRHILFVISIFVCTALSAQTDRQQIRQGNRLFHAKDYAKAEVAYRKALAANAQNPQAIYNLGCALMLQQKDSAAVVQFEKAAQIETNKMRKSKAFHNIGVVCQNHQMYGDAIKAYELSLRLNPTDDETRYNLALCKKLNKNQQNQQNQQQQKDKQNNEQNKDKQDQKKDQNNDQQKQQQPQEQMSRENAERLLDAAVQNEKATQQRIQKAMQQPRKRTLEKNW